MKKLILPILIFTVLLSGCKNPFEAKDKGVENLNNIEKRWEDAYTLASSTARIALPTPIANLQDIKRDLANVELSECLNPARDALNSYMDTQINTFLEFMADKDSIGLEPSPKLVEYFSIKEKCTGEKSPPNSKLAEEAKVMEIQLQAKAKAEAALVKAAKEKGVSLEEMKAIVEKEALEQAGDEVASAAYVGDALTEESSTKEKVSAKSEDIESTNVEAARAAWAAKAAKAEKADAAANAKAAKAEWDAAVEKAAVEADEEAAAEKAAVEAAKVDAS
jgi:hypothetical protein